MLALYVDESNNAGSGHWVAAGYLGNKDQWVDYVNKRHDAISPTAALHIAKIRLGSPKAVKRWQVRLQNIALVPTNCGLKAFVGSTCERDYRHKTKGTVLDPLMNGYTISIIALIDEVIANLPRKERLEVYFEDQDEFAAQRTRALEFIGRQPRNKRRRNRPVIAKFLSIPKSIRTEASDYLAYAILQRQIDPSTQKAVLSSPILEANSFAWRHEDYVKSGIVDEVFRERAAKGKAIQVNADERARLRRFVKTGELP